MLFSDIQVSENTGLHAFSFAQFMHLTLHSHLIFCCFRYGGMHCQQTVVKWPADLQPGTMPPAAKCPVCASCFQTTGSRTSPQNGSYGLFFGKRWLTWDWTSKRRKRTGAASRRVWTNHSAPCGASIGNVAKLRVRWRRFVRVWHWLSVKFNISGLPQMRFRRGVACAIARMRTRAVRSVARNVRKSLDSNFFRTKKDKFLCRMRMDVLDFLCPWWTLAISNSFGSFSHDITYCHISIPVFASVTLSEYCFT